MNNINLTFELCAEDRARLDKITDLLGEFIPTTVTITNPTPAVPFAAPEDDELRKKLEAAVASVKPTTAEPAEAPQEAVEAPAPVDTPAEDKAPAEPAPAPQEVPKVTLADIQQKVIALVQKGRKADVRTICTAYAPQVTQIPEDKWGEVMEKLTALEG